MLCRPLKISRMLFWQDQYELVHRAVAWLFRKEMGLPPNPKDFGHLYENIKLQAEVLNFNWILNCIKMTHYRDLKVKVQGQYK